MKHRDETGSVGADAARGGGGGAAAAATPVPGQRQAPTGALPGGTQGGGWEGVGRSAKCSPPKIFSLLVVGCFSLLVFSSRARD